jgi:hypothetical protein
VNQLLKLSKKKELCIFITGTYSVNTLIITRYKYDLSLPLTHFYKLVEVMQERLAGKAKAVGYGHVGDGILHFLPIVLY